ADQQDLVGCRSLQKLCEPIHSRILRPICRNGVQVNQTTWESADGITGVPQLHPPGPMTVEQCVQFWTFPESFGLTSSFSILFGFTEKSIQIIEPIRIEQSQSCKMTGHAKLLRRSRQEQETGGTLAELFDNFIFRAGLTGRPLEMMRLVDDQ